MTYWAGKVSTLKCWLPFLGYPYPELHPRSTGYGSLQVWMRSIRTGITYQETYKASDGCSKSPWQGSAFTVGGGYTWLDIYGEAASRNLVVVGGGTPVSHTMPLPIGACRGSDRV